MKIENFDTFSRFYFFNSGVWHYFEAFSDGTQADTSVIQKIDRKNKERNAKKSDALSVNLTQPRSMSRFNLCNIPPFFQTKTKKSQIYSRCVFLSRLVFFLLFRFTQNLLISPLSLSHSLAL